MSKAGHSPAPGEQEKVPPAASEAAVTRPSGMQTPVRAGTGNNSHLSSLICQVERVCVVMTASLAFSCGTEEGGGTCESGMQPCSSADRALLEASPLLCGPPSSQPLTSVYGRPSSCCLLERWCHFACVESPALLCPRSVSLRVPSFFLRTTVNDGSS